MELWGSPNVPFCCKRVRKREARPNTLVSSNGWLNKTAQAR